jgi:predicted RNase H-like nuclease (RuvC/YqgF family)
LSTLSEAIAAIKEVIKLTDDVKRVGETLKELSKEMREHDRRITRLEAQWETALRLSTSRGFNQLEGKQES